MVGYSYLVLHSLAGWLLIGLSAHCSLLPAPATAPESYASDYDYAPYEYHDYDYGSGPDKESGDQLSACTELYRETTLDHFTYVGGVVWTPDDGFDKIKCRRRLKRVI